MENDVVFEEVWIEIIGFKLETILRKADRAQHTLLNVGKKERAGQKGQFQHQLHIIVIYYYNLYELHTVIASIRRQKFIHFQIQTSNRALNKVFRNRVFGNSFCPFHFKCKLISFT